MLHKVCTVFDTVFCLGGFADNYEAEELAEAYLWLMKDSNVTGTIAYSDSGARLV
jgi:hypothetical protein